MSPGEESLACKGMLFIQMVKQKAGSNQCGACVVAMLIDRSREEILRAVPDSENPDYFWLNYMSDLGFFIGGCPK
jgi:hypothetical protein